MTAETYQSIPAIIESFIETIQNTKKFLFGFSLYGAFLAMISILFSLYLITHERFFVIMDEYNEFGLILGIFLGLVMVISSIWLAIGIKQYTMIRVWNSKYAKYETKMKRLDEKIICEFHLDDEAPN